MAHVHLRCVPKAYRADAPLQPHPRRSLGRGPVRGLELRKETNAFDFDTIADVVLRISYTAREGGELLYTGSGIDDWCQADPRGDGGRPRRLSPCLRVSA